MKSLWQGLCAIADTNKVCINLIKLNLIIIYVRRVDNSRRIDVDVKNYQSETNTCMVHWLFNVHVQVVRCVRYVQYRVFQKFCIVIMRYKFNVETSILIHTVFISCNRYLGDGVLDVAEYTDGMTAYQYDSHDCKDVFHIFAVVLKH